MSNYRKIKSILLSLLPSAAIIFAVLLTSCGEETVTGITYINNPDVRSFDSIGVEEDSAAFLSRSGIDLLNGVTTVDTGGNRDCSLQDLGNSGMNFYLENGTLDKILPAGYDTRFFRVDSNMNAASFDTLSKVWGYDSLRAQDFTQPNTAFWGYFNAPLTSYPVFCFWLKGKKEAGITPRNVYGIIQPREATDRTPDSVYGFKMSFRARININGNNDFRKQIPSGGD